uniref:Uncharacterized protein n=1 Tax=Octopus bimaculoides TaxID=37653 RepID=A0A0L8HTJ5_OCTBM
MDGTPFLLHIYYSLIHRWNILPNCQFGYDDNDDEDDDDDDEDEDDDDDDDEDDDDDDDEDDDEDDDDDDDDDEDNDDDDDDEDNDDDDDEEEEEEEDNDDGGGDDIAVQLQVVSNPSSRPCDQRCGYICCSAPTHMSGPWCSQPYDPLLVYTNCLAPG